MFVAFVPFPTKVFGEFINSNTAAAFYGLMLGLTGVGLSVIQFYATNKHRLIDKTIPLNLINAGRWRVNLIVGAYFLIALIGLLNARLSLILYILIPFIYVIPSQIDHLWLKPWSDKKVKKMTD